MTVYYTKGYNGGALIGVIIAVTIATGLLVIWRIAFRISRRTINASDYLIIAATILALAQACLNAIATTKYGYGYHKADLPPAIAKSPVPSILFWINQWFFKLETGLTKFSIVLIYFGIFKDGDTKTVKTSRILNYILAFVVVGYYTAGTFVSLFQCTPTDKAWIGKTKAGTCINNTQFRLANAYINVLTSAWIIALPLPTLQQLKTRGHEVAQVMGLILLGVIHTGCAIARLILMYYPASDASTDPQWANTTSNTVAMLEEFVGIMAATLMVMRPCFHVLKREVTGRGTTVASSSKITASNYADGHIRSQGFQRMQRSTDVELGDRNISTEEILDQNSKY